MLTYGAWSDSTSFRATCVIAKFLLSLFLSAKLMAVIVSNEADLAMVIIPPTEGRSLVLALCFSK